MAANVSFTKLDSIKPFKTSWRIRDSITFFKTHGIIIKVSKTKPLLGDEEGERMELTVQHLYYLKRFQKVLKEGDWYKLKDFWVITKPDCVEYTPNSYFIKFTYKTTVKELGSKSDSGFFKFVEIPNIIHREHVDTTYPIDTYGIIVKVSKKKDLPYVPNKYEVMKPRKYRDFYIVEMDGRMIKCCGIGECFEKFNQLWDGGYHDIKVRGSCVFCVLRFWSITGFEDEPSLINTEGCSRILFDPTIPDLKDEEYIVRFTWVFYQKDAPESDDEYENPWGPM